jgi:hypothetical protein
MAKNILIIFFILCLNVCLVACFGASINDKIVGIQYSIWHCPMDARLSENSVDAVENGNQDWKPVGSTYYWAKPSLGYYCLSQDEAVLRTHAEMLRDAGIDFVFIDSTNHAYTNSSRCALPKEMIMDPFKKMLEVWSTVPGAPKVVPWVSLLKEGDMIDYLLGELNKHPDMYFYYGGKPLVLVVDVSSMLDQTRFDALSQNYTLRRMWALYSDPGSSWSFLQTCRADPREDSPCDQRRALNGSSVEQISVTSAYMTNYMSNKHGYLLPGIVYHPPATPKYRGITFKKQFYSALESPAPIVTITSWNEFIAIRFCFGPDGVAAVNNCSVDQFPDGSKIFVDQYDGEYNRDMEPADNEMGDYYYRLMKSCVSIYKNGAKCDSAHADELCCKDEEPVSRCKYLNSSMIANFENGVDERLAAYCSNYLGSVPSINYAWNIPDATQWTDDINYWDVYDDGDGKGGYCDVHLKLDTSEDWSDCSTLKIKWYGWTVGGFDPKITMYAYNAATGSYGLLGNASRPNNEAGYESLNLSGINRSRVDEILFRVEQRYFSNLTNASNMQRTHLFSVSLEVSTTTTSTTTTTTTSTSTSSTIYTTTTTTTSSSTTTTSNTTTTSSTSTTVLQCVMPGNNPPCDDVSLSEIVLGINQWAAGGFELGNVIDLINSWADSAGHAPV